LGLHFKKKKIIQTVLLVSLLEGLATPLLAAENAASLSLGERRQALCKLGEKVDMKLQYLRLRI
jgi:hypothetical protein